jgi:hypothetical protein
MLNFDKVKKEEMLRESHVDPLVEGLIKAENERHPTGQFKLGPAGSQKKLGGMAFDAAREHIDNCEKAAQAGKADEAQFHANMSQQYAGIGVQNHMMGGYLQNPQQMTGFGDGSRAGAPQPGAGAAPGGGKPAQRQKSDIDKAVEAIKALGA